MSISFWIKIIIAILKETDLLKYEETLCEQHKQIIMRPTLTSLITFEKDFVEIFDNEESKDSPKVHAVEEFESQMKFWINLITLFKSRQTIIGNSRSFVLESSTLNPLFLPSLTPILMKCMKLLPL